MAYPTKLSLPFEENEHQNVKLFKMVTEQPTAGFLRQISFFCFGEGQSIKYLHPVKNTHICERIILDQKSRGNGDNITAGVQQNKLFKLALQSNFENSSVTAKLRRTYICLNWIII